MEPFGEVSINLTDFIILGQATKYVLHISCTRHFLFVLVNVFDFVSFKSDRELFEMKFFNCRPLRLVGWLVNSVYLSSLPVAHLSDAPRRRLLVTGDSARMQDETTGSEINLKINNLWTELFNFQTSFNCHWLELLRTAPLPIHKVIIITIF